MGRPFGTKNVMRTPKEKEEITLKAKQEIEEKVFKIVTFPISVESINSQIILYLKSLKAQGIYTDSVTYMEICTGKQFKK